MVAIIEDFVFYCPFFICLFSFSSLFISNWKKDDAKLVLSYFMLVGSLFFAIEILRDLKNIQIYNYFYVVYHAAMLLGIPLIYIYIKSLTLFRKSDQYMILHFIPAFILLYIGNILYFQLDYSERIYFIENFQFRESPAPYFKFLYIFHSSFKVIFWIQLVYYYIRSKKMLKNHQNEINQIFSDSSGYDLNWSKLFFRLITIWTFFAAVENFTLINNINGTENLSLILDIVVSLLLGILYIIATMQNSHFYLYVKEKASSIEVQNTINQHDLKKRLVLSFEQNKLYLRKDLTIWDVCRDTNSNRTYISNLINEEFKMNFNSFVNKYRVEHALIILQTFEYKDNSLEEIACLSGFNSLASFNRAFKKLTGSYPGSFKMAFNKI